MKFDTYHKIKRYVEKYHMIEKDDVVAAGVSGGEDYVCLLQVLWRMRQ